MKKIVLYIGFAATTGLVAAIFVTTKSYFQLAIAVVLYLPLVYFAFKLFPRKTTAIDPTIQTIPKDNEIEQRESIQLKDKEDKHVEVFDIEKRAFLKIIGATGLSFFITSLFTKRFGNFLGRAEDSGTIKVQDPTGNLINPAKHHPTDNYKISEVDYGSITYYGFIDQDEGWFIMKEDLNSGTYRSKGDTNFNDNWNKRENLKYDYFNQVFPKS